MAHIEPNSEAQPQTSTNLYSKVLQTEKVRASILASALANMFSSAPIHTKFYLPTDFSEGKKEGKNG